MGNTYDYDNSICGSRSVNALYVYPNDSPLRKGGAKFFIHTTYALLAILISLVFVLLFGSLFGKQDTTYTRMDDNKYHVHQKIKLFGEDVLDVNGDRDGGIAVKNGNTYYYQEDKSE